LFIRHQGRITFFSNFLSFKELSFRHYKICWLISPRTVSDSVKSTNKITIGGKGFLAQTAKLPYGGGQN